MVWIQSYHLHLQWKFKSWAGKFASGVIAKHCWALSTSLLYSKVCWQHPAMVCLYTFPVHNLNFHWRWRWWDRILIFFYQSVRNQTNQRHYRHTAGPWLMRFSVVRFSLVRSLKKIQKNLAYADFHQSPSLVRKISMIQIKISICQITISSKKIWHMLIFIKVLHLCGK